jgi:hypothetical protein
VDAYTLVGFVGVGCIVVAYFTNQQGWLKSEDWRFPTANLVGSLLIMASLWNRVELPVSRDRGDLGGDQPVWFGPTLVLALDGLG